MLNNDVINVCNLWVAMSHVTKFPKYSQASFSGTVNRRLVNKFAISNYTALILCVHALRSYLKPICEYELHSLPNKKVSGAKDHGKIYIKVRPPLVRHLLRDRLLVEAERN